MNYVFTGPESSGKSTLALEIAKATNGMYVAEYAREYISNLNREYTQDDLLIIAKKQYALQEEAKKSENKNSCFDTDLLTIKIWSEFKYGTCDPWILDRLYSNSNSFYILCKPDFHWEFDEQRENPNDREELFKLYESELQKYNFPYKIASGTLEERIKELTRKRTL